MLFVVHVLNNHSVMCETDMSRIYSWQALNYKHLFPICSQTMKCQTEVEMWHQITRVDLFHISSTYPAINLTLSFHLYSGQWMATGLWTLATGLRAASSSTHTQHSPRWVGQWGPWALRWRCGMGTVTMVWRMISVAWDMMNMEWGLHPCTLEAMVPCHAWDRDLGESIDEDWGKIKTYCSALSHSTILHILFDK